MKDWQKLKPQLFRKQPYYLPGCDTYTYANGDKYVGEFKDDKRNGQGAFIFGSKSEWAGDEYVGQFKDDKFHGQATYTFADGEKYIGQFRDGFFDGYGTFFYSNGDLYTGAWVKDLRQGRGDLRLKNGDRYVGEFRGGEISGTGSFYYKNGDRYHGGFRVGEFHGQGTFTHADGTVEEGIWESDQLKYSKEAEPPPVTEAKPQDDEVLEASSGSGFAVSSDGHVITNNHVIEGCQEVAVYDGGRAVPVTVITYDLQNDLALLKGDFTPKTVFALSGNQPELLQDVYVAGYPFGNQISSSIKVTKGIISSLTGIGNNFSNIQIDAALQVGNSGGPILDEWGNVVGVAVSKLDAKYMYDNFGTIPENTNFGIKTNVVRSVLDSNGVSSPSPSTNEITKSELGTRITGGTYYVSCLMTLAQIEVLRTKKVMFENLD
jgi:S1-C subfamily serine protease